MAFTHRDSQENTTAAGTSLTITKPAGLAVGDLMVAMIGKDDSPGITSYPSGWTEEINFASTLGNDLSSWVGYKIADAADVAASNFTWNGDSEDYSGVISAFIPSNSNPVLVDASTPVQRENDTTPVSNAIGAATAGNLLIAACTAAQAASGGLTMTTSGYTVAGNPTTGTGNGDNGSILAYDLSASGGETTVEFADVLTGDESQPHILEFSDDAQPDATSTPATVAATVTVPTPTATGNVVDGLSQAAFRVRSDATVGLNATTGWAAAENAAATIDIESPFRVRFGMQERGSITGSVALKVQYRHDDGGGFGSWTDLVADSTGAPGRALNAVEVVGAAVFAASAYTHDEATTDVPLTWAGSGTFTAGSGICDANDINAKSYDGNYSEHEVLLVIHRFYGSSDASVDDGDEFEFRMVESDGTVFAAYLETPSVTANLPSGLIGGTYIESPGRTIVADSSGNLYTLIESMENDAIPVMMKSSDDGVTWEPQDQGSGPGSTGADLESAEMVIDATNHRIHIAALDGNDGAVYHQFVTSGHATSADTWMITNESVAASLTFTEQTVSIAHRPTQSDVVVFYATGTEQEIKYKIRASDAESTQTWGTEQTVAVSPDYQFGVSTVVGESDLIHIFYSEDDLTEIIIYHETLNTSDALGGTPQAVVSGLGNGSGDRWPMAPPIYFDDDGVEVIMLAYKAADDTPYSIRLHDETPQTAQQISDIVVYDNGNASRQPIMAIGNRDVDVWCLFVEDDTTARYPMWRVLSEDGAAWGTETSEMTKDTAKIGMMAVRTVVYNDGSDDILGYAVDHGWIATGGTGGIEYGTYTLPALGTDVTPATVAATVTVPTPTVTVTASATVTPAAVAAVTAVDTPTIATTQDATVTPDAVAAVAAVPTPTVDVTQDATVTPAAVSAVASVPQPTVTATSDATRAPPSITLVATVPTPTVVAVSDATVTPDAVAVVASAPTPTVDVTQDATVTPAAVAVVAAVDTPTVVAVSDDTATPAAVAVTVTVDTPTITTTTDATVTPAAVAATAAVDTPTIDVTQDATVTPAAVVVVAAADTPTVTTTGDAYATPDAVAAITTVPTPTVTTETNVTVTPAAVVVTVAVDTPTVATTSNTTVTPDEVAATVAVDTPTVTTTGDAYATPDAVAATVTVPTPTVTTGADADATPAVVAAVAAVPTPTISTTTDATVTPDTVAATGAVPTPTITATSTATVTPDTVATVVTVPTPTVSTTGDVTATPDTVAAVATVPTPTISTTTDATVTPATVTVTVTVPTPTIATTTDATVTPDTVAATGAVPTPTITTIGSATVTPDTVTATVTVPTPTVTGSNDATVTPATVAVTVAVDTPTVTTAHHTTVTPATITIVAAVPTPTIAIIEDATVTPATVAVFVSVPDVSQAGFVRFTYDLAQFFRNGTDKFSLGVGIARTGIRGFHRSEGWERASGVFALPAGGKQDAMDAVKAVWSANKAETTAVLKPLITAALNDADYRRPNGTLIK